MLYQPSYPYPYLSDIDATEDNTFYCCINAEGGTTVIAYTLTINDLSGNEIYTTNRQFISMPLYSQEILLVNIPNTSGMINGRDYVWNIELVESNADIWRAFGTIQEGENTTTQLVLRKNWLVSSGDWVVINSQKIKIINYDFTTGIATLETELNAVPMVGTTYNIYGDSVKSNDYLFNARSTPVLSINNIPQIVTTKSYTFIGDYIQAQGVNYKYFVWTLYDELQRIITTTGEISTGNIEYTFDGFINGSTYGIGLLVENQDGVTIDVPPRYFKVEYQNPEIASAPSAELDCDKTAVRVLWTPLLINNGEAEGVSDVKYNYIYNQPYDGAISVNINAGCNITWNVGSEGLPIFFNYESTTYIHWHTPNPDFNGIIYKQEGVPIDLIALSLVAPTMAKMGDRYYNIATGYIYTAVEDNTWGLSGEEPSVDILYKNIQTNLLYIYDGTTLQTTTYQPPTYTISYDTGVFYYSISNGDFVRDGEVRVSDIYNLWLLQPLNADTRQSYGWLDTSSWNDTLYWTESLQSFIDKFWFKITLLPTEIQIKTLVSNTITFYIRDKSSPFYADRGMTWDTWVESTYSQAYLGDIEFSVDKIKNKVRATTPTDAWYIQYNDNDVTPSDIIIDKAFYS